MMDYSTYQRSRQILFWQILMIYQITVLGIKCVQWFFGRSPVPVSKLLKLKRFLNNCHKCCLKEPADIKLIIKDYDWLTWEYWSVWRWSPQSQHTPSPCAPLSWRWPAPCMCVACIWPGTWNSTIKTWIKGKPNGPVQTLVCNSCLESYTSSIFLKGEE